MVVSVSASVHVLANNALRAHHASAHGGLSANVLSDICLSLVPIPSVGVKLGTCVMGRNSPNIVIIHQNLRLVHESSYSYWPK